MVVGHANNKERTRVTKVEIVYANVDKPSDATVYRIKDAEKFMAAVKKAGIKVNFEKMF